MADFEQVNAGWIGGNSDFVLNVLLKFLKGIKIFVLPKVAQGGQFIRASLSNGFCSKHNSKTMHPFDRCMKLYL